MSEKEGKIWNNSMSILYIVATPIGNLADITGRAIQTLREVDTILCEDTRVTRKLLDHYQIKTPTLSYHQHSGEVKKEKIISLLKSGKDLALVTDAGTPGVSDPGSQLVTIIRQELAGQVEIVSVPGVSALTAALSLVGLGFDHFLFLGFLPHKKGRQSKLQEITQSVYSIVLYESKYRLIKLLTELSDLEKNKKIKFQISIGRELTKLHESFYQGSIEQVREQLDAQPSNLKGEFVVLLTKIK